MDKNLEQNNSTSTQEYFDADTASTLTRGMEMSLEKIAELNKTIRMQREIITEQAMKIHELGEELMKFKMGG